MAYLLSKKNKVLPLHPKSITLLLSMTDTTLPAVIPEAAPVENPMPQFNMHRVFLKGISLEMPQGPTVFLATSQPSLNVNLTTDQKKLSDNVYEVTVTATLTAHIDEKVAYLLETQQSGIFEGLNLTKEQLLDALEIGAPSILGPYLRAQITNSLASATLPIFYMPDVNWAAMAQAKREKVPALVQ
ncbi:protein-export chaperone SecB [Nostoc sp. CHAB 5834]|nr:protein-export chaperone SecB [Nostoc sp. CHAB 5834]